MIILQKIEKECLLPNYEARIMKIEKSDKDITIKPQNNISHEIDVKFLAKF